jgi:hypothetical protein
MRPLARRNDFWLFAVVGVASISIFFAFFLPLTRHDVQIPNSRAIPQISKSSLPFDDMNLLTATVTFRMLGLPHCPESSIQRHCSLL